MLTSQASSYIASGVGERRVVQGVVKGSPSPSARIEIITAKIDMRQSSQLQMLHTHKRTHRNTHIHKSEHKYKHLCTIRDDAMRYVYVIEIAFIIGLYFDMGTTGKQTSLN